MKRYIRSTEDIFAMSKIVPKYAVKDRVGTIDGFIYFSECNSTHGPRIKFYGGTSETSNTRNAPSMTFDVDGNCQLELADWMDHKNCPNVYDSRYLACVEAFIHRVKPILLLVWFRHLDEADALAYFHGQIEFSELIDCISPAVDVGVFSMEGLDEYCRSHDLYRF